MKTLREITREEIRDLPAGAHLDALCAGQKGSKYARFV